MRKILFSLLALFLISVAGVKAENPKREFRGAWLHIIGQSQWAQKSPAQQRAYIIDQLDKLEDAGCNAVIFQVRPTADAAYKSDLEPWSQYLTGKRGKAPSEDWDPMEFFIEEAHKRGMEFHAWLNPYRVTATEKDALPEDHISKKYPERFVKYGGQVLFDPAYQENRDFICEVVSDILTRYDVDAIHMDDYFYPYPKSGQEFGDSKSYAKFGNGMNKGDWRRHNVDLLIEQLHNTIKDIKPWVRFGISPFGIWRNKSSDPKGSNSSGLQNYDSLYADILLWAKNGWIDYIAPQLYWELDLKVAPSRHLAEWWNDNSYGVDVYIGQDTKRTMDKADTKAGQPNELDTKVKLSRSLPNVKGNVWWHGYWVTENYKGVRDKLSSNYQNTVALPPAYGDKNKKPKEVSGLKIVKDDDNVLLVWDKAKNGNQMKETDVVKYLVYEFLPDEDTNNLENSETIIMLTPNNRVILASGSEVEEIKGNTYVVTSIDRMNRESSPVKVKF